LENAGAEIRYPAHFNLDPESEQANVEKTLRDAINLYHANNPSLPTPVAIVLLLHRYLREGIGQRGSDAKATPKECLKEIILTTIPVLQELKENSDHLLWVEEIAARFAYDGCINQPVAGWFQISAMTTIALAPTILEKIIATQHLRVLEGITEYIACLPRDQKPGAGTEIEFGNALFREVYKKLFGQGYIKQPWLGVPKSIAYEGMITSFLTQERIDEACNLAIEILQEEPRKVAKDFCEGAHKEFWAQITFPVEIAEIKNQYAKQMELLEELLKGETKVVDAEQIKEAYKILEIERATAIATKVMELTLQALDKELGAEESKENAAPQQESEEKVALKIPNQTEELSQEDKDIFLPGSAPPQQESEEKVALKIPNQTEELSQEDKDIFLLGSAPARPRREQEADIAQRDK
jgi:hypothetical protein